MAGAVDRADERDCARWGIAKTRSRFGVQRDDRGCRAILRIAAGDPDNSLIVQKVRGEAGSRMPFGGTALSDEAIAKIVEWIEAGANP